MSLIVNERRAARKLARLCGMACVAAVILFVGLGMAWGASDRAQAAQPASSEASLELGPLNGPMTYTAAFPWILKPDYLLIHNFDGGDSGWVDFVNYWRLNPDQWYWGSSFGYKGGGLRHDQYGGGEEAHDALTMYLGPDYHGDDPQEWDDYEYTAKVNLREGNMAGVWFRGTYTPGQPSGRYVGGYYFWISPHWGGLTQLQKLRNSGPTAGHFSDPLEIAEYSYPIQANHWHTLRVRVEGSHIQCWVDDTKVFDVWDATWPAGTIGFMGYRMDDARFDEVLVEPVY